MIKLPPEIWQELHAIEVATKTDIWCQLDAPWLKTKEQLVAAIKLQFHLREQAIQRLEKKHGLIKKGEC